MLINYLNSKYLSLLEVGDLKKKMNYILILSFHKFKLITNVK